MYRGIYFNGEKLYFDIKEDDLLERDENDYMVETKSSLLCEKLTYTILLYVGVEGGNVQGSTQHLLFQLNEKNGQIYWTKHTFDDLRSLVRASRV